MTSVPPSNKTDHTTTEEEAKHASAPPQDAEKETRNAPATTTPPTEDRPQKVRATPRYANEEEQQAERAWQYAYGIDQFRQRLERQTPRLFVTSIIISLNAVVFLFMVLNGISAMSPKTAQLLTWGANHAPYTLLKGEWWRLLSAMFVHAGLIHFGINMWVLTSIGSTVERLTGNVGYALLYLVAGLFGSFASLAWNPSAVSVGASGAIFGVFGALFGYLLRHKHSVPPELLSNLRRSGLTFLVVNLLLGASIPAIDNAAHMGGLAAGFGAGWLVSLPVGDATTSLRIQRNTLMLAVSLPLLLLGMMFWPKGPARYKQLLQDFAKVEEKAIHQYNYGLHRMKHKGMKEQAFAKELKEQVLPQWRKIQRRLEAFPVSDVPRNKRRQTKMLLAYVTKRGDFWQHMANSVFQRTQLKAILAKRLAAQAVLGGPGAGLIAEPSKPTSLPTTALKTAPAKPSSTPPRKRLAKVTAQLLRAKATAQLKILRAQEKKLLAEIKSTEHQVARASAEAKLILKELNKQNKRKRR